MYLYEARNVICTIGGNGFLSLIFLRFLLTVGTKHSGDPITFLHERKMFRL